MLADAPSSSSSSSGFTSGGISEAQHWAAGFPTKVNFTVKIKAVVILTRPAEHVWPTWLKSKTCSSCCGSHSVCQSFCGALHWILLLNRRLEDTYCGLAPAIKRTWIHSKLPDRAALWMGASPTKSWKHNVNCKVWDMNEAVRIAQANCVIDMQKWH